MHLTVEGSFNQSLDMAVKRYSLLFGLPSYRKAFLLLGLVCVVGSLLSIFTLFPSVDGLVNGLFLGFSLFSINLVIDYLVSTGILRRDPIYDLRRTVALSLFCWALWFFFIFIGVATAIFFGILGWIKLCLLGFSAVIIFRLIVLNASSSMSYKRLLLASIIQPISCMIPFLVLWSNITNLTIILFFLIYTLAVGFLSSFSFISLLNRVGRQALGFPSLSIFKAFLLNWTMSLNAPFEEFLEKLGEEQDVEISILKFDTSKAKAIMAVPSVHPGPFKNIGSSLLPSMLKTALEERFNCVAYVPHGLLGHELDLASRTQNVRIINHTVESADFDAYETEATPFVKSSNGLATACCQIFGKSAFIAFTLAPNTTEDFPQELALYVRREVEKHGLISCVIINAHNSINGVVNEEKALDALKAVAAVCLEETVSLRRLPFRVGAATAIPKEFGLKDGMGPGGITVVVVEVGRQKTAYVVIDGNNMVSGLREKILSALQSMGIDEGEVFTTDTHSVNALTLNERGYYPIGEAIDHEKLISYTKEATRIAMADLEPVKAACHSITVPKVKVIGKKPLEKLCLLIDKTLHEAKKVAVPLFAFTFFVLMLFLMLF
jgi:putative membrane protein